MGEAQEGPEPKLGLRSDRTITTASRVAAAPLDQLEFLDFALAEPDLASVIKQIYNGALSPSPDRAANDARP